MNSAIENFSFYFSSGPRFVALFMPLFSCVKDLHKLHRFYNLQSAELLLFFSAPTAFNILA